MTYLTKYLSKHISLDETLLDVCCGPCRPTKELRAKSKVGIDLDTRALAEAKQYCSVIRYDVNHLETILLPDSFDVVFWLDGIEHLELDGAVRTLKCLERVARKRIVVFTPNQRTCFDEPNELMRHKSFFPKTYWEQEGWTVNAGEMKSTSSTGEIVEMVLAVKEK